MDAKCASASPDTAKIFSLHLPQGFSSPTTTIPSCPKKNLQYPGMYLNVQEFFQGHRTSEGH